MESGWTRMEPWNIPIRRPLSRNIAVPPTKVCPVASDSQRSHSVTFSHPRGLDASHSFTNPDRPVGQGRAGYPPNEGFVEQQGPSPTCWLQESRTKWRERRHQHQAYPWWYRARRCDARHKRNNREQERLSRYPCTVLSEPGFGSSSSPASRIHPPSSTIRDQDR